jgi:hypothetical protein
MKTKEKEKKLKITQSPEAEIAGSMAKFLFAAFIFSQFLLWICDRFLSETEEEKREREERKKFRKIQKIENKLIKKYGYDGNDHWLLEAQHTFLKVRKTRDPLVLEDWRIKYDPTHPAHFNRRIYGTPEARLLKAYHGKLRTFHVELAAYRRLKNRELGTWDFTVLIDDEDIVILNSKEGLGLDWIDRRDFHKIHEEYRKGGDLTKFRCGKLNYA